MRRKKTNEEYISELQEKNPSVVALDEYIGSRTKINHKCLIHNVIWSVTPDVVLRGSGCPECYRERQSKSKTKTHEEYISEVANIAPNIKVLGVYSGALVEIPHQCTKCGNIWNVAPTNILSGHGCPICAHRIIGEKSRFPKEMYLSKMKEINPNVELIGEYKGLKTKARHKCLIDGYEWDTMPSQIMLGHGCPLCGNSAKKTHDEFVRELANKNNNIIVVGEYTNARSPIEFKCKICGHNWVTTPSSVLRGTGCIKCRNKRNGDLHRRTDSEYNDKLSAVNKNVIPLERYIDNSTPILHKCTIDGFEWYARPGNLLMGCGCPKCKESKGERDIARYLQWHGIEYERQKRFDDCRDKNPLPFDFYLPSYNAAIEYDGLQHRKPIEFFGGEDRFQYMVKHDNIKNEYCNSHGIKLLRISHTDDIQKSLNNFLFAT